MDRQLARPDQFAQFIHRGTDGVATGLVEASLRRDYVNGATESPVVFVEGLYVEPFARGGGIARRLIEQVADWAVARGIGELASDALLDNRAGHAVHRALGFQETERVVYFRKSLAGTPPAASKDDDRH